MFMERQGRETFSTTSNPRLRARPVWEGVQEEGEEVRRKVDTAGQRFEKTNGRGAPGRQSALAASASRRAGQQGSKQHGSASQSKRTPAPVVEQHGAACIRMAFCASQEHAHGTRRGPAASATMPSIMLRVPLSCLARPVRRHGRSSARDAVVSASAAHGWDALSPSPIPAHAAALELLRSVQHAAARACSYAWDCEPICPSPPCWKHLALAGPRHANGFVLAVASIAVSSIAEASVTVASTTPCRRVVV